MKGYQVTILFWCIMSCWLSTLAALMAKTAVPESRYTVAHSLGDSYEFDSRDGWQTVNVTNLDYKYNQPSSIPERRSEGKSSLGGTLGGVVKSLWEGLKGVGTKEDVTITWYTGHDLLNPSCWANGKWAPTDTSFAAALTLEGWTSRPKCFKFLELCNSPKKCVFVRVVDTCAGCAPGTKHVDLTRAAFCQLADFKVGVLKVQLRQATEPDTWHENLWGPKVKGA